MAMEIINSYNAYENAYAAKEEAQKQPDKVKNPVVAGSNFDIRIFPMECCAVLEFAREKWYDKTIKKKGSIYGEYL